MFLKRSETQAQEVAPETCIAAFRFQMGSLLIVDESYLTAWHRCLGGDKPLVWLKGMQPPVFLASSPVASSIFTSRPDGLPHVRSAAAIHNLAPNQSNSSSKRKLISA